MRLDKLIVEVDASSAIHQCEEWLSIVRHYDAIHILIDAVKRLPDAEDVLYKWDVARNKKENK